MRLREWRLKQGLSLKDLAEKLGVDKSTVSRWESGSRIPTPQMLARIYMLTKGTVTLFDFLLTREEVKDGTRRL